MNVEFHYYMINYLARKAGFNSEDAEIISYSSQFVDNALYPYLIETDSEQYPVAVTQNFTWWEEDSTWTIYVPFHFFPGNNNEESIRRDLKSNSLNCRPDSENAKQLLIAALKSKNLYRIGIALHTYADTFAHQNFTGQLEDWNKKDTISIIPPVGHAQFTRLPDDIHNSWEDNRLQPGHQKIINKTRFYRAAQKIYRYLCTYNRRKFKDEELILACLFDMAGKKDTTLEERIQNYQIYGDCDLYNANEWKIQAFEQKREPKNYDQPAYDKLAWLTQKIFSGIRQNETRRKAKPGFYNSHYYKWSEAAKEQRKEAWAILGDLIPDEVRNKNLDH